MKYGSLRASYHANIDENSPEDIAKRLVNILDWLLHLERAPWLLEMAILLEVSPEFLPYVCKAFGFSYPMKMGERANLGINRELMVAVKSNGALTGRKIVLLGHVLHVGE
ncbi:hypothetical protein A3K34_00345 [candidate division WWE3 bacterium RIFOXYC1_FULL_40_10]|uniref:Uncharacterized protein n=1 Tax=candidate division WWE3 bacterium RIFOXYA2_FULL_46_9 TaxID=1802636 RepID=A0A1F4W1L3_UNCKA|nr:MAG: hypothetical protein A3K58_00345 [candidate division WWE3 bacterium RIFOXYB1_FULL_40_22]OGC61340.1 MAG: hypothetical protein A3K37_00345 [candidate division WWE3 bacterium RIFOXYA1_FULL_40_11]OGC63250.1 MAG: hypothetical protein A2264_01005 [candidate division WWE3 bacterium RIFOXYA2_FULL_46_9]OGC65330.1 MAG: hypothetical protein A2326_04630 [candidate division WWE3 bacterium RIFOXYB2_FULL_41_6]OGC65723.1 MAG: hypothetical protein A3K34_00345 [candidate division WWE3 bacterium RIFOXYC1_